MGCKMKWVNVSGCLGRTVDQPVVSLGGITVRVSVFAALAKNQTNVAQQLADSWRLCVMTDRVLTEEYVDSLALTHKNRRPWRPTWTAKLIASHRLLQKRVAELETTIGWYEAKHPND